jgi:hypothetical protein
MGRFHRRAGLLRGLPAAGAAFVVLAALGCTHDARLEAPQPNVRAQPILLSRAPDTVRAEVLQADIALLGLPLAHLESTVCPGRDATTLETRVDSAALINALHRSGGDARTELTGLAALRSEVHIQDGDLLRHYETEHRAGSFDYEYDNGGEARRTGHGAVPEAAFPHDLQSALLLLRGWRPRLGETGFFFVVLGRRLWRTEVTYAGPQMLQTSGTPRLTHRLDGVSVRLWQPSEIEPRRFSLWLSEDAERVPLRMVADASFGEVTLTLTGRRQDGVACKAQ